MCYVKPYKPLSLLFAALGIAAGIVTTLDQMYDLRFEFLELFYDGVGQELLITTLLWIFAGIFFLLYQVSALREELEERRRSELLNNRINAGNPEVVVAPTDGEPLLKATGMTKVYDTGKVRVDALRGIDLEVLRGEMVVIMGPSGCGKTTLLNCLSGIDDVTEGQVYIRGMLLSDLKDNERTDYRAARMGFVFQSYNLIPVLTVVDNVELPLLIMGVDPKDARQRALEALSAVNLEEEASRKPMELSGGQQQRVAIARAIVNDPEVVFADEPTGNLDSETSEEVVTLLRELNRSRRLTLVMVTHDPSVSRYADRILTMRSGQIVEEKEFQEA
ncbi:MAG: ABC transporter ATP-binding protein [Thermoplasmata archaeon]